MVREVRFGTVDLRDLRWVWWVLAAKEGPPGKPELSKLSKLPMDHWDGLLRKRSSSIPGLPATLSNVTFSHPFEITRLITHLWISKSEFYWLHLEGLKLSNEWQERGSIEKDSVFFVQKTEREIIARFQLEIICSKSGYDCSTFSLGSFDIKAIWMYIISATISNIVHIINVGHTSWTTTVHFERIRHANLA